VADIYIQVWGEDPVPQGSKSISRSGHMYEANKNLDPWRKRVAEAGREEMAALEMEVIEGPVWVDLQFIFARPKKHYRANGSLRPDAPRYCTRRPDTDKLIRAIGDALTGVVWKDDSLIVRLLASKRYTMNEERQSGVSIAIAEMMQPWR